MLVVKNLTHQYSTHNVLDNLWLSVEVGSIQGIVGVNGAGKTTLLHILWGKITPTAVQEMSWQGQPLQTSHLAFLEAHPYFYSRITGKEYLQLFQAYHPDFQYEKWNQLFELPLDALIDTYSSGMKKKLAFMATLSTPAPLLVLDEPFNNLDIETNLQLKEILTRLKQAGKTILVTSHVLEVLTSFCDQIHLLTKGRIEASFEQENFHQIETLIVQKNAAAYKVILSELIPGSK